MVKMDKSIWMLCTTSISPISFCMIYSALVGETWRNVSEVQGVVCSCRLLSSPGNRFEKVCCAGG